jgi:hypothetical protein
VPNKFYLILTHNYCQVFEDHSTYHGDGKKIAREVVRSNYAIFPSKNIQDPKLYAAAAVKNVKALVDDGSFLHCGKDANVGPFI